MNKIPANEIDLHLGKKVSYVAKYDNNLLVQVPRKIGRSALNLSLPLPFNGVDIWNCYEVSWLSPKGKPCARVMQFIVSANSEYLLESKSVKLYLNSFNDTKFSGDDEVKKLIQQDFSQFAKDEVVVNIYKLEELNTGSLELFEGINIDDLDVEISDYSVNKKLLELSDDEGLVCETLYSNLLKSNCLITNQPDWASVQIKYSGKKIKHESLLKYIISFRKHNEFHEQCIEHMYVDIMDQCAPTELTIYAKYTRRGGVDINPYRTSLGLKDLKINEARDIRQ